MAGAGPGPCPLWRVIATANAMAAARARRRQWRSKASFMAEVRSGHDLALTRISLAVGLAPCKTRPDDLGMHDGPPSPLLIE